MPLYTCKTKYTIQPRDTCASVSRLTSVSTFALAYINFLPSNCKGFPGPGTEICVPERCKTHTVRSSDTCAIIAQANRLTVDQLLEYNPNINWRCTNLRSLVNSALCVSPPGLVAMKVPRPKTAPKLVYQDM